MIAQLEGILVQKSPTRAILDVQGVGYELLIPVSTFEKLPELGKKQKLLTYLHVREDAMLLFGFAEQVEKSLFLKLISVSGVGPKLALGILSGCPAQTLTQHITRSEVAVLTRLPGVGKKTAERLVIELRDKLDGAGAGTGLPAAASAETAGKAEEAVLALVSLGYSASAAEKNVSQILMKQPDLSLDELVKRALQNS